MGVERGPCWLSHHPEQVSVLQSLSLATSRGGVGATGREAPEQLLQAGELHIQLTVLAPGLRPSHRDAPA